MTFIHPQRHAILFNILLALLITASALAALWVIVLYNGFVNATHAVTSLTEQIQSIKARDAELKDTMLTLLSSSRLESLASSQSLVEERKPEYFQVQQSQSWALASQ